MEGIVKWWASKDQPWGFIKYVNENGEACEVFSHYKGLTFVGQENPKFKVLKPGQRVSFDIVPGFPASRGSQAVNVKVVQDGSVHIGDE